ncbi:MAG TPA: HAMP domain-containing sensor histidine kinase [Dehalococcoidia bacterium]|nr:HAMP domain-containing sensor histidine kinase [Dehalococcoidia bacterium]
MNLTLAPRASLRLPYAHMRVRNDAARLVVAVLASVAAIIASVALSRVLPGESTTVLLVAVLAVAWYCDMRAVLLAVLLTSVGAALLVFDPVYDPGAETVADAVGVVVFVFVALVVGTVTHHVSVADDERARALDQVRRLNDRLREANQMKDEFVGLVAHELRTPVTVIRGNAEVLARRGDALDPESRAAALRDVVQESSRLAAILDDLLMLARLDRGVTLPSEPLIVERIVARCVAMHQRQFPHRKLALDMPPEPALATAVPVYVEQIIRNLLSNAEKYSPSAEPIDITVRYARDMVEVRVLDRGRGVPDAERDAVFEPFVRGSTHASTTPGAGIGLALCKRMAELQGGRMWLRPRPGGGSEFGFAVPLAPGDADGAPDPPSRDGAT